MDAETLNAIAKFAFVAVVIIAFILFIISCIKYGIFETIDSIVDFLFSKECQWCGNKIPVGSKQKQKVDGLIFCCVKCSLKYMNEREDVIARGRSARGIHNTQNINYNDRNKYLKD